MKLRWCTFQQLSYLLIFGFFIAMANDREDYLTKRKKNFHSVFIEMQIYSRRHESRTLPEGQTSNFFGHAFYIDKNLTIHKSISILLQTVSSRFIPFKPLFLFFLICTINGSKKFENEKWPKAKSWLKTLTQKEILVGVPFF